jgi:hypothetical protein
LDRSYLLHRVLILLPLNTDVIDGLFIQVLEHLGAELVGHFVRHVEDSVELRDAVDRVVFFDGVVLDLLLRFAEREDAVLGDVVAVAVS